MIYPDLDHNTIVQIIEYAHQNSIPEDVLLFEDTILDFSSESDPAGATFGQLRLHIHKRKKTSLLLKWTKTSEADGYILYGNHCNAKGKKYKLLEIAQLTNNQSSYVSTKVDAGKLQVGTYYKYLMYAYKEFNGQKIPIAASVCIHGTTMGNRKNTVASAVQVFKKNGSKKVRIKSNITIKAGQKIKLFSREIPEEKNKTIRPHRPVCFETEDSEIASVGRKTGVLRGLKKGTVILYAYAQNGIYCKIKVTVK